MPRAPLLFIAGALLACQPPPAFRVPAGTAGAQVFVAGVSAAATVELLSPSGRRLSAAEVFAATTEEFAPQPLRALTLTNPFALIEAGDWDVEVSPPSSFTVTTRLSPALGDGELGVIDLRFILATNCLGDVAATRALVEQQIARSAVEFYVRRLQVGEVHFVEREVRPCSLTREVTSLADLATSSPEVVFVVSEGLEVTARSEIWGWAPLGASLGVASSGLGVGALSVQGLKSNGATNVLMHELGHWAGLVHSIESNGIEDTLDDTPSCAPWLDGNGNGVTDTEDCGLDATVNFMFWADPKLGLSETQAVQMQRALTSRVVKP